METYRLACCGYSKAEGDDLLIVNIAEDGKHSMISSCRQGDNPSFGIRHGAYLYTVEEVAGRAAVAAWLIDGDCLQKTDMRIEVPGGELCHLYAGEKALFGSSYGTGDFFAVDYELKEVLWHRKPLAFPEDFEPASNRQRSPHAHWTAEWQGELFLSDLGSDRIWRYQLKDGLPYEELSPLVLERGAGPRQPLPTGQEQYLLSVQELDSTLCLWKKEGEKTACVYKIRTTAYTGENNPGTMCMADENTVLVCNRGANTISAIHVGEDFLEFCGEWETAVWPRHLMNIPGTNLFVNACNEAGKLVIFAWVDGKLERRDEIVLAGASCAAYL